MSGPKVTTLKRGDSRFYVHPADGTKKVPGVTSVVGMLPKPFLTHWAAKVAAEFAIDNMGAIVDLAIRGERQAAVDMVKGAHRRFTGKSADVGTEVHDLAEALARGHDIGRVHPDVAPYTDGFKAFLDKVQPRYLHLEDTVWSSLGYAGSFDAIAEIDAVHLGGEPGVVETVVVDNKTTRSGVHEEVALQLAAYRFADYIVDPDTGAEVDLPTITGGAVVHLRPELTKVVPVRCDEEVFEVFKHLLAVFAWEKEQKGSVLGRPLWTYDPVAKAEKAPARQRSAPLRVKTPKA